MYNKSTTNYKTYSEGTVVCKIARKKVLIWLHFYVTNRKEKDVKV